MLKAAVLLVPVLACAAEEPGRLTLEALYHPARKVSFVETAAPRFLWRPDGGLIEERPGAGPLPSLYRRTPGRPAQPWLDAAQLAGLLSEAGAPPVKAPAALVWNDARDACVVQAGADLYLVDPGAGKARRLGTGEAPLFSPDGAWVAYLDGFDLRAVACATGKEVQLTSGGTERHRNGRLDWVYEEEVFNERGNPRAFWWSPDSRRIAFLSLDDSQVPTHLLTDDRKLEQKPLATAYPMAGQPNPRARLGVAGLDGSLAWMEDPYPGQETLVPRVGWTPDGKLVAHHADRVQSWLECRVYEAGGSRVLVREQAGAWVEHLPLPHFLKDGRFLWLSARSGYHHLYLHDAGGRLLAPVTAGAWDVRKLLGVDEAGGVVYFEGTQRSAVGLDAYRCDLGGPNGHLRRLTEAPGSHALTLDPQTRAAVDHWSSVDQPGEDLLLDREGVILERLASSALEPLKAVRRGSVLFQQVKTRDGFPMETMRILPPDFDPAKRYPVFQYVYGGPSAPLVRNAWNRTMLFFHFLAQQGIVTWICDNRSASGKGLAAHGVHGDLGAQELRDQLDGLAWLRAQGWADMDRIALHGYSYGGFLTGYAATHSKAWKLAIIGAPVTDWRLYDSVYTERLMGLPADNPKGYEASSVIKAAKDLAAKTLFIHGTLDDNVHPQNTVQMLDALQKAGHSAALIQLPGSGHSPRAPQHLWAMYAGIWEFLQANL